jgi:DNA-directed RNA polymerase I, II, and III subunit RPABC1
MEEKVRATCVDMLRQRGYSSIYTDDNGYINGSKDNNGICIFIISSLKFNVDKVHEYITIMNNIGMDHGIIVYKDVITPYARKIVAGFVEKKIELFTMDELQFNITKHVLVPQHKRLTDDEMISFKQKYGVKIPILLKSDPISRFYNFSRNDIIQITRPNGYVAFRIVR